MDPLTYNGVNFLFHDKRNIILKDIFEIFHKNHEKSQLDPTPSCSLWYLFTFWKGGKKEGHWLAEMHMLCCHMIKWRPLIGSMSSDITFRPCAFLKCKQRRQIQNGGSDPLIGLSQIHSQSLQIHSYGHLNDVWSQIHLLRSNQIACFACGVE